MEAKGGNGSDRGLAAWERGLWSPHDLIAVTGGIAPLLRGREAYRIRHGIESVDSFESERLVARLLAGACAAAVSLPVRESWGWTVTVPGSAVGLFCAIEPDGRVAARVREASPLKAATVVQRQRAGGPLVQSHVISKSTDPLRIVEHYFEQAEQAVVRMAASDDGRVAMVRPLPTADERSVLDADDETLLAMVDHAREQGEIRTLDEVILWYGCRCSDEMILEMISSLPPKQHREVWADDREISVECPRCGRRYTIRREAWDSRG